MSLILLLAQATEGAGTGGAQTTPEQGLDYFMALAMQYAIPTLKALAILLVAWMLSGWASDAAKRLFDRTRFDPTLARFFSNFAKWGMLVLGVLAAIGALGVQLTVFAAVIGAAGLAIGLALQGSLGNIAAGIMLLIFRPFKIGDVVEVAGETGTVTDLDLFTTSLDTADGRRVILPNGQVFGNVIENITYHPVRRVDVAVGVAYSADVDRTRAVLEAAARRVPGGLADPEPGVGLVGLGASSVDWTVMVWARRDDIGLVKQATIRSVKLALDEAGIEIPFPQTTVTFGGAVKVEGEPIRR
jgi:small conductance mechanosensitive channel